MIGNKDSKRSLVIPKWCSYRRSCRQNEFSINKEEPINVNSRTLEIFEHEYAKFQSNKTFGHAIDLFSSSIVIGDNEKKISLATYLKRNKKTKGILYDVVESVLRGDNVEITEVNTDLEIAKNKKFLRDYPNNPIYWLELARLYTIKGQNKKAKEAATISINLSPYERFIVRSVFRFFIHIDEFDRGYHYVKNAVGYNNDPWIRATEINAAILNSEKLKGIKYLNTSLIPEKLQFHYSELIETQGILELRSGNTTRAKRNFRFAWQNPSESVIAHGEWVMRNHFPNMQDNSCLDYSRSTEALTWHQYYNYKIEESLHNARKWSLEEPYSSHPFISGSSIACSSGKANEAIDFAKEGLIANSDDLTLKNNLAYAYLLVGNITEAEKILDSYPRVLEEETQIYYYATSGLLYYMKKNYIEGRERYLKSINLCRKLNNKDVTTKAIIHHAIAEIKYNLPNSTELAQKVIKATKEDKVPDIVLPRRKLIELMKTNINTIS